MSSKIKAIVIDDEKLARAIIKGFAKDYESIEIIGECSNGFEAIKSINEHKPDLIFLDIQMPKITGFEMLELIEEPPVVIFTTAYDQYAIKAFEVNAADYLLKPFSKERFDEAIQKAKVFLNDRKKHNKLINNLVSERHTENEFLERIVAKRGTEISIIPADEIKWIEAQDDYVMLHTAKGKFLKQKRMKYYESSLSPENFVRVHRSYIVALEEINKIELAEKETYIIITKDEAKIPVSKSGYAKLKEILNL